ncbi:DNA polymerase II [Sinobacterium norvegicum]|uniref:DNA polymerase n=1 Tax=Sinobacterium norvegicum TaxID=1641715 RepID=A0ABM9AFL7_9GAMM|nr:DNA polymerase II [Sinobacterium norvegicum]CAH0991539.1 DNA polymerase II [Sinobacterium norvegicum]
MPTTVTGFLLSRQWRDVKTPTGLQLQLSYWLTSPQGPLQLLFDNQQAVFFVPQSQQQPALDRLKQASIPLAKLQQLELTDFQQQPLTAFYFAAQRYLYQARKTLKEHNIEPLEADIRHSDRFLMERFITAPMTIKGDFKARNNYLKAVNPQLKTDDFTPLFSVLSLDIETAMYSDELFSIGCIFFDQQQRQHNIVLMVGSGIDTDTLHFHPDQQAVIEAFLILLQQHDPDIIIGWNVINFDLRFLQRVCQRLGISFTFGRGRSTIYWQESQSDNEHYTLTVPGRVILDGIDTLKSATYSFESFSLNHVAEQLLKRQKLLTGQHRGEDIAELFNNDKPALAAYNLEDCQLVWDIFQHTKLIDFAIERARLTGLAMDRFGGSVAAFDFRYLPRLHRSGYIAPNLKAEPEGVGSPGGYVMDSFPGLYRHVLVLDFKSLYPSIIRTFKIDPIALINGLKQQASPATRDRLETNNTEIETLVSGFNGALFDKQSALLPAIIAELWQARDSAKEQKNASMSQAIKIIMNSFYGVLGTPGCRFFDYRLPSSITLRGHNVLNKTKELIEQQGHRVIYGDTDSVFVWLSNAEQGYSNQQVDSIGNTLAAELNLWWRQHLHKHYQLDSHLEIEFESHFQQFIMPTIRGSEVGSKKRYAGLVTKGDGLELIFKGLEAVRTDWTRAARDFQRELYRRIFYQLPYKEYIKEVVSDIRGGKLDQQLIYRKRLRRKLDDYQKNIPPHVQAARLADQQRIDQGLPPRYQRGGWVEYVMTLHGPQPADSYTAALDYDLYIERQIEPIADGILHFLETSFDAINNRQINLFDQS